MSWDPSGGLAQADRQAPTAVYPTLGSTAPVWAALVTVLGCCLAIVGSLLPWAEATARTRLGDVLGGLGGDDLVVALNTGTIDGWDTTVGKLILVAAVGLVLCVQALVLLPRHRTVTMPVAVTLAVALLGCGIWAGVSVLDGGSTRDELLEVLRSRDIFSQLGIEAKDPATSASEGAVITVVGCALAGVLSLMLGRSGGTRRDQLVA